MDVYNLIDYMLISYWRASIDALISIFIGPNQSPNNFFCTRPRDGSTGFGCVMHDSEHTMLPANTTDTTSLGNRLRPSPGVGWPAGTTFEKSNPQYIFQQIWNVPEVRLRVAEKIRLAFFDGWPPKPPALTGLVHKRRPV